MTLATTLRSFWTADPWGPLAPPAPVTGFIARGQNTEVNLYWDENVYATGFRIRRNGAVVYEGPHPTDDPVTGFPRPWTDTGLVNGVTYDYTITSYNAVGESSAATASTVPQNLVTGLTATEVVAQSVYLSWTINTAAGFTPTAIDIRRDGQLIATLATSARNYRDMSKELFAEGLGYTYRYSVVLRDAADVEYLDQVYVTTPKADAPVAVYDYETYINATTVNIPLTGVRRYDMVFVTIARQSTAGASAVPAGFQAGYTALATVPAGYSQSNYWAFVGNTSTVPTSVTFNFAAAAPTSISVVVYRGSDIGDGNMNAFTPPFFYGIYRQFGNTGTTFNSSAHTGYTLDVGPNNSLNTVVGFGTVGYASAVSPTLTPLSADVEMYGNTTSVAGAKTVQAFQMGFRRRDLGEPPVNKPFGFTSSLSAAAALLSVIWIVGPGSAGTRLISNLGHTAGSNATTVTGPSVNWAPGDGILAIATMPSSTGAVSLTTGSATLNTTPFVIIHDTLASAPVRTVVFWTQQTGITAVTGSAATLTHPTNNWRSLAVWMFDAHGYSMSIDAVTSVYAGATATPSVSLAVKENTLQIASVGSLLPADNKTLILPSSVDSAWSIGNSRMWSNSIYHMQNTGAAAPHQAINAANTITHQGEAGTKTFSPTLTSTPTNSTITLVSVNLGRPLKEWSDAPIITQFAAWGIPL